MILLILAHFLPDVSTTVDRSGVPECRGILQCAASDEKDPKSPKRGSVSKV
jgi:hypothetical protein